MELTLLAYMKLILNLEDLIIVAILAALFLSHRQLTLLSRRVQQELNRLTILQYGGGRRVNRSRERRPKS